MDYRASWSYPRFPSDRQRHLGTDCPSYCEIIRQLGEAIKNAEIVFQIDKGRVFPVDHALRPLLYVDVNQDLVDWFFNGVRGYRAQYYKSPETGLQANAYAFAKLEQSLFGAADRACFSYQHPDHGLLTMTESDFLASLRLPSAKIWGDETNGQLQEVAILEVASWSDIDAHRWLDNAEAGNDKAQRGIKAPRFTTLKFHGAFLKNGQETVPLNKMARSADIYFFAAFPNLEPVGDVMSKQTFAAAHRQALWEAYDRRCFYCRTPIRWDGLRIDHVVPEHLARKPDKLAVVLGELGLPKGWDLSADHNLVAACDPCNLGKRALLPQPNQTILWLAQVERKAERVSALRQQFEREREADILRAQLETALALKQISEREVADALVAYAAGGGAVQLTSGIEFLDGVTLDRLRPDDVRDLLDVPVKLGANLPEGLELMKDGAPKRHVRTSREYRDAVAEGYYAMTTFDIKMEAFFKTTLGILTAIQSCRPAERSFIRQPRVGLCDLDLLPTTMLDWLGDDPEDVEQLLKEHPTVGSLVAAGEAMLASCTSYAVNIRFHGMGSYLREMLRADFEGDGYEGILVSSYTYAVEGTHGFGHNPYAVVRRGPEEPFIVTSMVPSPACCRVERAPAC